jgi:hypothetical protein
MRIVMGRVRSQAMAIRRPAVTMVLGVVDAEEWVG